MKYLIIFALFFISLSTFSQVRTEVEYVEVGVTMNIPIEPNIIDYIATYQRVDFFNRYDYHYIENEFNNLDGFEEEITYDDAREYVWDPTKNGILKVGYQGMFIYFDLAAWRFNNPHLFNRDSLSIK